MRKQTLAGVFACLALTPLAAADSPAGDVFAGYSVYRVKDDASGTTTTFNGWQASLAKNLGGHLGLVADVSGHSKEGSDDLTYMGGLRYAFHGARGTLFVHGLAGRIRNSSGIEVLQVKISQSETVFAWAAGGGLSFRVSGHWDVRIQGDYLASKLNGESRGNVRLAAGLAYVFR